MSDVDRILSAVETAYDTSEALQRRKGVNSGVLVDRVSYAFEVGWLEDLEGVQVGDDEGVARRCGLRQLR